MKTYMIKYLFFLWLIVCSQVLLAQTDTIKVIQFSGLVVTEQEEEIIPLAYTNISIMGTSRGTVSELNGFFSLVGKVGETVVFSRIGYKSVEFEIPDTMQTNMYSFIQIMSQDSILLPMAVIRPWPSKEYFDLEFLAMDVSNEMQERARENLAENALARMRNSVPGDGFEAGNIYLQQQAAANYYNGQFRPQKVFDLAAWAKFVQAWKRGDFKRKKKK